MYCQTSALNCYFLTWFIRMLQNNKLKFAVKFSFILSLLQAFHKKCYEMLKNKKAVTKFSKKLNFHTKHNK